MRFILASLLVATSIWSGEITDQPLILTKGGTPENPVIFDGKGLTIDLGVDITNHTWKKEGNLWTSTGPIAAYPLDQDGQCTGLFIEEIPITLAWDTAAERARNDKIIKTRLYHPPATVKPGQMGVLPDGSIYFRWPASKTPGQHTILCPPKPWTSGITIACSHIIVRNITAKHASNDGFNIHNKWVGIRLENVRAFSNGDEGISAHGEVQMDVAGAEIAWNGSIEGGVADVDRCTTTYKNCIVHDNLGPAFKFTGKSHSVTDTIIFNQAKDFSIGPNTLFTEKNISRQAPKE
ncbi:hypothetical protein FEM03_11110 [Phragmitibacter flavus]|uniref:Right-handed parallel beta-helix repeat-containing protein n=1 Tax=Phragmitibacter flavus TaxID=2576071 RepID=A0A5R8KEY1_9BACT|nr:hypothetical protein [Phragmitibacter flavus]TLD70848.1 hypothetical protein FEM03_11110 [Phragmitibacter flavus]